MTKITFFDAMQSDNSDFTNVRHIAIRRCRHWIGFWWFALILANGLVGVAILCGIYLRITSEIPLAFFWIVSASWSLVAWTRSRLAHNKRLLAGFQQPFAEEILAGSENEVKPYVLFLRSFDAETTFNRYTGVNEDSILRDAQAEARPVEALLVSTICHPILTLIDPRTPEPMPGAIRFSAVPDDWEEFVSELSRRARLTVMHLTDLTPGVVIELKRLIEPVRDRVIIIKSDAIAQDSEVLKIYPHQLQEGRGMSWNRQNERDFVMRLIPLLQNVAETDGKGSILRNPLVLPTLTPSSWVSFFQFFVGPLISSVVLFLIIDSLIIYDVFQGIQTSDKLSHDTLEMLGWMPWVVLGLAFAKGFFLLMKRAFKAGEEFAKKLTK